MIKINKIQGVPTWVTACRTILRILTTLILIVIIPLIVINLVFIFQSKNQTPTFMGYSMLNVISGSMTGTIDVGDMIIVKQTEEIKEQDIITFIDENSLVTHRVIKIETINGIKTFTTKGDANDTEDRDKITVEQIRGKVVFYIGGLGRATAYLQKPYGLLILVSLPILAICITKFFEMRFANKKIKRKQQRIEYMSDYNG